MDAAAPAFQYYNVTAIGTNVVRGIPAILHSITPEVSVGTVTLYDSATAAGTATGNRVFAFTGGTSVAQNFSQVLDIQFKSGIVAVSLGTPVALLSIA